MQLTQCAGRPETKETGYFGEVEEEISSGIFESAVPVVEEDG